MALDFEKLPRESVKAYEAFKLYLELGPQRSLAEVGRKLGKSEGLMERWSRKFAWVERVEAHGKHVSQVQRRVEDAYAAEKALDRAKRDDAQSEAEWNARCEAFDLAREAMARWKENPRKSGTLEGIARMLELASKLGRLAIEGDRVKRQATVREVRTISVEFRAEIERIYGQKVPEEFRETTDDGLRTTDQSEAIPVETTVVSAEGKEQRERGSTSPPAPMTSSPSLGRSSADLCPDAHSFRRSSAEVPSAERGTAPVGADQNLLTSIATGAEGEGI